MLLYNFLALSSTERSPQVIHERQKTNRRRIMVDFALLRFCFTLHMAYVHFVLASVCRPELAEHFFDRPACKFRVLWPSTQKDFQEDFTSHLITDHQGTLAESRHANNH